MPKSGRPLALVTLPRRTGAAEGAERACEIVVWPEIADGEAFLAERGAEIRAIVTASTLPMPAPLDRFPALELLAFFGAGHDIPETAECLKRGIAVSNAPAINHLDVADLAIGLIIATIRRIGEGDRLIRAGKWDRLLPVAVAPSLRDLRYGIVGLGAIGVAIGERLAAFGGEIMWWAPRAKPEAKWPRVATLLELAGAVDVLIVAVRADEDTRGLIDAAALAALGPDGYLVNMSRGFVIDEDALVAALGEGRLAGAGLDVFAKEPTDAARWAGIETVVLTPHVGAWTHGSTSAAQDLLAENLRRHFAGQPLLTPVTR